MRRDRYSGRHNSRHSGSRCSSRHSDRRKGLYSSFPASYHDCISTTHASPPLPPAPPPPPPPPPTTITTRIRTAGIKNLTNLKTLYVQNEHLTPVRQRYCRQRIPNVGKYNWRVVREEYQQMTAVMCPDMHDGTSCRAPPHPIPYPPQQPHSSPTPTQTQHPNLNLATSPLPSLIQFFAVDFTFNSLQASASYEAAS